MRLYLIYFCIITSLIDPLKFSVFNVSFFRAGLFFTLIIYLTDKILKNNSTNITITRSNSFSIKFMLIWFSYAIISFLWVKDYIAWLRDIYFLGIGLICALTFSEYLKNKNQILTAFRLFGLMIVSHNLFGWYEVLTGNYLFLPSIDRQIIYSRLNYPVSMFKNTNDFATFMLIGVFVSLTCAVASKSIIKKIIYYAIIVSSISLVISTGSRANLLGLILSISAYIYFSVINRKTRITLTVIFLLLFSVVLLYPEYILQFYSLINEKLYFSMLESGGVEFSRVNLIKNGIYFLFETFGFGTGAGNIEYWITHYSIFSTGKITVMHNWWIEILTAYGVIIFILYLLFYKRIFTNNYTKFKNSNNKTDISISLGILCIMIGFTIGSISSSSNMSAEWLWVFWAILIAYQGVEYNTKENHINLNSEIIKDGNE